MWAKGHDFECIFLSVRAKKGELATVDWVHRDLMIPRASVKTDEIQSAMTFTKVINGIVASWYGVSKGESDCIESVIAYAHPPSKLCSVCDFFLMQFCS